MISARRVKEFLERAKNTFHRIVEDLETRAPKSDPIGYSLDPKTIEALEKQLSSWPEELSVSENFGHGRALSEASNVYVHGSRNDGNHVSLGSVWYVPLSPEQSYKAPVLTAGRTVGTASWTSEDPSLSPEILTAIVMILEPCGESFGSEFGDFLFHYLGHRETPLSLRVVVEASDGGIMWMPFHLRCFGNIQSLGKRPDSPDPKIVCRRYKAIDLGIRERRRSIELLFHL